MNAVTQSHRIKFARVDLQRHFDIAQILELRQLGKSHRAKLFRACHLANYQFLMFNI
jgi:hypothetical protein